MKHDPAKIAIYHITDVENLTGILNEGGLNSDALIAKKNPAIIIGYDHIKRRRLTEIRVPCCGGRFVGEFVPFYICLRSPMLYRINIGNTGRPAGCQHRIVHLVSTMAVGIGINKSWAVSSGNAGAYHTVFYSSVSSLDVLDWRAIHANDWRGKTHQKSAEFLATDFFPWTGFEKVVCYSSEIASTVKEFTRSTHHQPLVEVNRKWYY